MPAWSQAIDRLVPVCDALLTEATRDRPEGQRVTAYALMRGVGNLCIGAGNDARYDAPHLVHLLIDGVLAD